MTKRSQLMPVPTDAPALFVTPMTHVSNRKVIERCKAWGCDVLKTSGEWTHLKSMQGVPFKLRSAQQHNANSKIVFDAMLEAMELTWTEFMGADLTPVGLTAAREQVMDRQLQQWLDEHSDEIDATLKADEEVRKVAAREERKARKAAAAEANKPREVAPVMLSSVPHSVPVEDPVEVEEDRKQRQRYINRVFDLMVNSGESMSNHRVATELGISQPQATSALATLCQKGVLERIKSGVYRATHDQVQKASQHGLHITNDGVTMIPPPSLVAAAPQPVTPAPVDPPTAPTSVRAAQASDDTVNDLLDLMFPNGFRAKDLPLIDVWRNATVALMNEVGR